MTQLTRDDTNPIPTVNLYGATRGIAVLIDVYGDVVASDLGLDGDAERPEDAVVRVVGQCVYVGMTTREVNAAIARAYVMARTRANTEA